MSAVFKLDNCLLWCNPDLYCMISRYFVLVVLSLVLLVAVDHHLSKLNRFVMSSGLLRPASMELSPFKTVSVKLEIIVQKWRKCLFLFALLTQLGWRWSDLQREPQQHNLPSIFHQNEDGTFCLRCSRHSACLFCCRLGWCVNCVRHSSSKCRASDAWRKVTWLYFLLFFHKFFIAFFVIVLDVLIAGDLRLEYAQSTWGFLFRGPPGSWLHLSCLRRGNWRSLDNDCCRGMSIVMILTTSSKHLFPVRWWGHLVAPRLITMALLVALEGRSSHERFGASQWWHWLRPLRSVMALIVPIAIGNSLIACYCLLQLCLVPMLASCSQLGFLID